jgi:hypothetical protein
LGIEYYLVVGSIRIGTIAIATRTTSTIIIIIHHPYNVEVSPRQQQQQQSCTNEASWDIGVHGGWGFLLLLLVDGISTIGGVMIDI